MVLELKIVLITYGNISKWVDAGLAVDVVFLDFSKAFDVVSHDVMIEKLGCLGFDVVVLRWIWSFLVGR